MIPKDETFFLKETLISKSNTDKKSLPFGFVKRKGKKKKEIDCKVNTNAERTEKNSKSILDNMNCEFDKGKLLGNIISSLLESF